MARTHKSKARRAVAAVGRFAQKPLVQHVALAALGAALGWSCPHWPEPLRGVCRGVAAAVGAGPSDGPR